MTAVKDEFKNVWTATFGVIVVDRKGEASSIPLRSGETVWLSEEEQVLTANAPRDPEDNVLANGRLKKISAGVDIATRRPLAPETAAAQEPPAAPPAPTPPVPPAPPATAPPSPTPGEEVGTVVAPQPEPEVGQLKSGEEVATPAAATAPAPAATPKPAAPKPAAAAAKTKAS